MKKTILILMLASSMAGCAVYTVASTAVSVTATVVETTVDVAAAGVKAVLPKND